MIDMQHSFTNDNMKICHFVERKQLLNDWFYDTLRVATGIFKQNCNMKIWKYN
jgi:hypothetical protein